MRVLFAEDDKVIRESVKKLLTANYFSVDAVDNGLDALEYARSTAYVLMILDIMMPGLDGLEVVKRARAEGISAPVLFLTARDAVEDRVSGLYAGADDYLVKPFAFEELLARVHALTRRSPAPLTDVLTIADLTLDTSKRRVSRGGKIIRLTSREYAIAEYMLKNAGRVLTREQIENVVWNYEYEGASNMVDVYIRYLRKKLDDGFPKKLIHTVKYAGYVMRAEE